MPGVPVTFNPMFHAEAKAEGTLSFQAGSSQVLDGASSQPNQLQMCGAAARSLDFLPSRFIRAVMSLPSASILKRPSPQTMSQALNVYSDVGISAFALPVTFQGEFDTALLQTAIKDAVLAGKIRATGWPRSMRPPTPPETSWLASSLP